jgi:hypothetical protein
MTYVKKIWKDYPDTITPILASDMNNIENGIENIENEIEAVDTVLNSGWIDANETWTYASVDDPTGVITISGDKTTKYSVGMRIKFTNATNVIYGIITAISYSSPNTTLTFLHEIDPTDNQALYLMQNSAITNNYYSMLKAPFGFPLDTDKWIIEVIITSEKLQENPVQNVWYNLGSISITIPIGKWKTSVSLMGQCNRDAADDISLYTTLSTTNDGETNVNMTTYGILSSIKTATFCIYKEDELIMDSKTVLYLNAKTQITGLRYLIFMGNQAPTIIKAVCAYL